MYVYLSICIHITKDLCVSSPERTGHGAELLLILSDAANHKTWSPKLCRDRMAETAYQKIQRHPLRMESLLRLLLQQQPSMQSSLLDIGSVGA